MVNVRGLGFARRRAVAAAANYDDALPSLAYLAEQKRWDEAIEILQFQRKVEHWLCVPNPANMTALHMVLPHHPPVILVDQLIASLARLVEPHYVPEATVDILNQTPLHVAASAGCDISVLRRLTKMSHLAVFHHDNLGRLPLHCLCSKNIATSVSASSSSSSSSITKRKKKRDSNNTVHCIHLLVDIYPQACDVGDIWGRTPLDLAIENKADQRIILALLSKTKETTAGRFRHPKTPVGSAATKSTGKSVQLPLQVVRTSSTDEDDVSSVGLRSFYWKARSSPRVKYRRQQQQNSRSGPVEV